MPIPHSREMSIDPKSALRTVSLGRLGARSPSEAGAADSPSINAIAELVADLLSATHLIPADRLAAARGRAGGGSLAYALLDEGLAESEGIARSLARQHGLPLVNLAEQRVSPDAAKLVELRVLKRVGAIPFALAGNQLQIALSDPENIHGIDELRLASRYPVELFVANRED